MTHTEAFNNSEQPRQEALVEITSYSDPVCTWCWGSEPVFRALESHFPGHISFKFVMGGLVDDARNKIDVANGIGSDDFDQFNRQVAAHWVDASARHGMPVDAPGFHLFSEAYPSTYPQNIAYEAAKIADPAKADEFLYLMRAATAAFAQVTSKRDVQLKIAAQAGIEEDAFLASLNDGSAEAAFLRDRVLTAEAGVHGFPTFKVAAEDRVLMLGGYQPFSTFSQAIEQITNGELRSKCPGRTPEAFLDFLDQHPMMALEEVRQAFDFTSKEEALRFLEPLEQQKALAIIDAGNGKFAIKAGF